jgi:hypothetical protein
MAFGLGSWTKTYHQPPFNVGDVTHGHFELADLAATSGSQLAGFGISHARALINQKGFGSGNGSVGPIYELQVAADSAFTSNVRVVDEVTMLRTGRNQTAVLYGPVPDVQTNTYVRIAITLSGTDAITADAIIDVAP